jgi:hypothetical protein
MRSGIVHVRAGTIDLITAAGSLNYVDLDGFFGEARRVLAPDGWVVAYDFSPGKTFRDSDVLDEWFASFVERYPWPPNEAAELDPDRLADGANGFALGASEAFEIGIRLTPDFYLEYMMTETNVAFAVRRGESAAGIRAWCGSGVKAAFDGREREVLFRGYLACLERISAAHGAAQTLA